MPHALKAAKNIGRLAYLIALIGTLASYGTQVDLLRSNGVGAFSFVIPATVDLLAIAAAMALQLPGLDVPSRRMAGSILVVAVAVAVSVTANITGAHDPVSAGAHAWPVLAYLAGELLANRVRAYAARLSASQTAAAPTPAPMPAPAPIVAVRPVRVAVAAAAKPRRTTVTARPAIATVAATVNPATGQPYSERHARRLRTGK